jgi:hypothetical protein
MDYLENSNTMKTTLVRDYLYIMQRELNSLHLLSSLLCKGIGVGRGFRNWYRKCPYLEGVGGSKKPQNILT